MQAQAHAAAIQWPIETGGKQLSRAAIGCGAVFSGIRSAPSSRRIAAYNSPRMPAVRASAAPEKVCPVDSSCWEMERRAAVAGRHPDQARSHGVLAGPARRRLPRPGSRRSRQFRPLRARAQSARRQRATVARSSSDAPLRQMGMAGPRPDGHDLLLSPCARRSGDACCMGRRPGFPRSRPHRAAGSVLHGGCRQ